MVTTARIYDYRNACGFAFYFEVCKVCNSFDLSRLLISEQVQKLEVLLAEVVDEGKVKTNVLDLPEELLQLDNRRYAAVKSLKLISAAYRSHFNPVKAKAGKQIEELLTQILPKIEMKCLESASDAFASLSQSLFDEPIFIQAMDLLKITDIAQEMSFSSRQFEEKFSKAEVDQSSPNRDEETGIYSQLRVRYDQLLDRIHALSVVNDVPEYGKLVEGIQSLTVAHSGTFERTSTPIYF